MTNAQVALLAAAMFHGGKVIEPRYVETQAAEWKKLLDLQDAEDKARIRVG